MARVVACQPPCNCSCLISKVGAFTSLQTPAPDPGPDETALCPMDIEHTRGPWGAGAGSAVCFTEQRASVVFEL